MSQATTPPPPPPDFRLDVVLHQPKSQGDPATFTDAVAKTLAGGYVFVAFILTTVGAFQGGLERILLNHPVWTLLGLLAMGAGIALAFVDAFIKSVGIKWLVIGIALVLFGAGLIDLAIVSTKSLSNNERPQIAATASMSADGSKLEGHVTAFGVKAKDWVYVSAVGLESAKVEEGFPLFKTRAGPGRTGKVDLSFTIPVAFNRFQRVRIAATRVGSIKEEGNDPCFEDPENPPKTKPKVNQSCATIFLKFGPTRPTLTASWEKSDTVNVISVSVKASGVNPDDIVLLDMAGNSNSKQGKKRVIFYRSMFSGSSTGVVDATAKAPMPKGMTRACVVATTISAADIEHPVAQPTRSCAIGSLDLTTSSFAVITVPKAATQASSPKPTQQSTSNK